MLTANIVYAYHKSLQLPRNIKQISDKLSYTTETKLCKCLSKGGGGGDHLGGHLVNGSGHWIGNDWSENLTDS